MEVGRARVDSVAAAARMGSGPVGQLACCSVSAVAAAVVEAAMNSVHEKTQTRAAANWSLMGRIQPVY
jgi:hypothetical protein